MARRKFENWWKAFTKNLQDIQGWSEHTISTLDKESYRETYFNDGFTVEEAVEQELSYMI